MVSYKCMSIIFKAWRLFNYQTLQVVKYWELTPVQVKGVKLSQCLIKLHAVKTDGNWRNITTHS
jgi:hypothetical protein